MVYITYGGKKEPYGSNAAAATQKQRCTAPAEQLHTGKNPASKNPAKIPPAKLNRQFCSNSI